MNFLYKVIRSFFIKDYTYFEFFCFYIIFTANMNWWQILLAVIAAIFANNFLMDVFGTRDERR